MKFILMAIAAATILSFPASAQDQIDAKVDMPFNVLRDFDELTNAFDALAKAHPELCTLTSLGKSSQGRDIWMLTINNPLTGEDIDKPAMWIDGNVHGNEIQAGDVVLYTAWYLLEAYDEVPAIKELVDSNVFYLAPSVNPDGRAGWFRDAHSPHTNRSGLKPTDNDQDGLFDEDGPDDLDGDGNIGRMWKSDPNGTHRRNERDPRIFELVDPVPGPDGRIMRGQWSRAGTEGIDNDGDGRINEDSEGGYDMNRDWPTDWKPTFVQRGASHYPFAYPETRAVGDFIRAHPNIAAGQSYHNTGGMILRGPGAEYGNNAYSRRDSATYKALGDAGEEMLPHYRYLILYSDLYPVHGGFVNWIAEGLGVVSFTNELWTDKRILQNGKTPDEEGRLRWNDRMLFGQTFTDWTEHDHPTHGKVLIGGPTKFSGRIPPPFMIEEESHRNFAFTMFHAAQMPKIRLQHIDAQNLDGDLWEINIEIANDNLIPTRTDRAANRDIGRPDILTFTPGPGTSLLTAGTTRSRTEKTMNPQEHRPQRLLVDSGIPGRGFTTFRYLVESDGPPSGKFEYMAEKAANIRFSVPEESP